MTVYRKIIELAATLSLLLCRVSSFGTDGAATSAFGAGRNIGTHAAVGADGRDDGRDDGLVETGMLLRYLPDGSPDLDFAPDGRQEFALGAGSTAFHAMTLDRQGRLIVAGRAWTASDGSEFLAARLIP